MLLTLGVQGTSPLIGTALKLIVYFDIIISKSLSSATNRNHLFYARQPTIIRPAGPPRDSGGGGGGGATHANLDTRLGFVFSEYEPPTPNKIQPSSIRFRVFAVADTASPQDDACEYFLKSDSTRIGRLAYSIERPPAASPPAVAPP